ncbi:DNA polymerase III subunit delta' [Sphingomonas jatrophae]|uniref:DNA polymerase-3 subunit delta n=1 Tax=Sphingomonas jatrophae TaxID=1166337 RepID=A0A1I6JP83_9SPHN|nr:DNA polymerase III subunit delta' [Sphingomonas jatrophae]SFR80775.1 DNA polymerase-3 subunit delta' [Sphingomonas jatrophae]
MTLWGHDANIAALRDAAGAGRLHHAWLLAGPQGVGKATFADRAAARLLADAAGPFVSAPGLDLPDNHPTARLIAAGSHPDLMRLERLERDKGDRARSITVDQVRGLSRLFASAGSFSERRIVVIDAIDDLEAPAANALLKNLEEPPQGALFLLVSHAPARLLPTIRSRCRLLRFSALDDDAMTSALAAVAPHLDADERAALVRAGEGAPGRALALAGLDVAALDRAVDALIAGGDPTGGERVALGKALALKSAQARYELFLQRLPQRIAAHARRATGERLSTALDAWSRAREIASIAPRLSLDPQATVVELAGIAAALAPERAPAKA